MVTAVLNEMQRQTSTNGVLLEDIRQVIREELQEVSFVAAPPVFEQAQLELTEEQHRAALEATFANGPIKKYRNLIPALMENYAATVGFKRCYSIITELKKFLSYKRMIVKDDRLKAYVYNPEARY